MHTPRHCRFHGIRAHASIASLALASAVLGACDTKTNSAPAGSPTGTPPGDVTASGERPPSAPAASIPAPNTPSVAFVPADQRILIAKSMLRASRFAQAETALRVVLQDHPEDAQTLFLLGLSIHKQKRYAEAMLLFQQALASRRPFPELDHLFYVQGWCAYNLGDLPGARTAFEEHLRRVPGEADSVFGLGVIALDEDRLSDAERLLGQAIAMQAEDAQAGREVAKAHARMADVHLRRDNLAEARQSLRRALELYPDHYEAWAKMARVLERQGLIEEAAAARAEEQAAMIRVGRLGAGSNQDGALPAPAPGER